MLFLSQHHSIVAFIRLHTNRAFPNRLLSLVSLLCIVLVGFRVRNPSYFNSKTHSGPSKGPLQERHRPELRERHSGKYNLCDRLLGASPLGGHDYTLPSCGAWFAQGGE